MTCTPDQFQLADPSGHIVKCSLSSSQTGIVEKHSNVLARDAKRNHSLTLREVHRLVPFHLNNPTHPIPRKIARRTSKHRTDEIQTEGSDPSEPLSISTWLTTMKPLMTPLSPRNDGPSVDSTSNKQIQTDEQTVASSRMKLPIPSFLSAESAVPVSLPPSIPFPLWVTQDSYEDGCHTNSESVLPDVTTTSFVTNCYIKSSPNSSPIPEYYPELQGNCSTSKPNSVVIPTSYQDSAVEHNEYSSVTHTSEVSGSSCHLVKLNINSPKVIHQPTSPVLTTPSNGVGAEVNQEDSTLDRNEAEDKKKTRITIEIETGGECIIFLPVDKVEYRVVARECPECSNRQRDKTVGRKPTVMVETKR